MVLISKWMLLLGLVLAFLVGIAFSMQMLYLLGKRLNMVMSEDEKQFTWGLYVNHPDVLNPLSRKEKEP